MPTLHVHLDESGDWNFHRKGSKYYILAAAWTFDPKPLAQALTSLRYRLVKQGISIEGFHASPDKQATRDSVVQTLLVDKSWRFASVVMEKRRISPALRDPHKFYPKFASVLLRFILTGDRRASTSHLLVYADTLPIDTRAKRGGAIKAIKSVCSSRLRTGVAYHVFSHCHQSNPWIQVADYCCWGVQRKYESRDLRTYNLLASRLELPELLLTDAGDGHTYY